MPATKNQRIDQVLAGVAGYEAVKNGTAPISRASSPAMTQP